ncbi:hypothetical protein BCEN4_1800017 [Burkholderia cenocepacia]|nr:hypothetical protein BCEN4_1800017 [Burkholderia cenocepacia]
MYFNGECDPAIAWPARSDEDIRFGQSLEALWFSMVRVRVWPGGNAVPRVDNYPASQSKPCVFQR